jgi:two-component system response regulator GlrR
MARVLVVDDHPDSLRMMSVALQAEKHVVVCVESPAAALATLRQERFDLVIADHNMPGMTGEALLERVGALHPQMGRLMLTADFRVKDEPGRGYTVMHRPFKLADLRDQVNKALGK